MDSLVLEVDLREHAEIWVLVLGAAVVLVLLGMRMDLQVCWSELALLQGCGSIVRRILELSEMHLRPLSLQRARQVSTWTS